MNNQELIFSAIINSAAAFARNAQLKKYHSSCVMLFMDDGTNRYASVYAGDREKLAKLVEGMMKKDPHFALVVKTAWENYFADQQNRAAYYKLVDRVNAGNPVDQLINGAIGDVPEGE